MLPDASYQLALLSAILYLIALQEDPKVLLSLPRKPTRNCKRLFFLFFGLSRLTHP